MLMSTYGTNSTTNTKRSQREFKDSQGQTRKEVIAYPEVVHNHYLYRHSVDDHNNRRHSPIGLEEVWGTKGLGAQSVCFHLGSDRSQCETGNGALLSSWQNEPAWFQEAAGKGSHLQWLHGGRQSKEEEEGCHKWHSRAFFATIANTHQILGSQDCVSYQWIFTEEMHHLQEEAMQNLLCMLPRRACL